MNSHWREEELIPYLDGRLSAAERARLDQHLAGCAACRAQLDETRALMGVLEEWKAVEPSAGFDAALRARMEAEKSRSAGWFALRPAYAAAAVFALLLVVGLSLVQWGSSPSVPPSATLEPSPPVQVAQTPAAPASGEEGDLTVLDNRVLLENYELLEEFDVLFEPLSNGEKKL